MWKLLLEDPRLSDDMVREALYGAAQQMNHENLPRLLADRRIGFGTILHLFLAMPADKFGIYQRAETALKAELLRRSVLPAFVGISSAAIWMMHCRK